MRKVAGLCGEEKTLGGGQRVVFFIILQSWVLGPEPGIREPSALPLSCTLSSGCGILKREEENVVIFIVFKMQHWYIDRDELYKFAVLKNSTYLPCSMCLYSHKQASPKVSKDAIVSLI